MERGRSLSELGSTLRWSDLAAFVRFLPASSHFRSVEEPDLARRLSWLEGLADPQVILVGELYDLVEAALYGRAGQDPPAERIVQRLGQRALVESSVASPAESAESVAEEQPARRGKSSAEIRAQLGL